jgi:hypothetical protein
MVDEGQRVGSNNALNIKKWGGTLIMIPNIDISIRKVIFHNK